MKRYYAILVCIILASNIGIACAQEVECQNVKYEILDGHQVRVMRVFPHGPRQILICKFLSRFARTIIFGKRKSCKLLIVN